MFKPVPQQLLDRLPPLYANEKKQIPIPEIIIPLHLFVSSCDWWIAEFDGDDIFWGFVNLGDDMCAEWGYVSYSELRSIGDKVSVPITDADTGQMIGRLPLFVEWDENWKPRPFRDVRWRKQA